VGWRWTRVLRKGWQSVLSNVICIRWCCFNIATDNSYPKMCSSWIKRRYCSYDVKQQSIAVITWKHCRFKSKQISIDQLSWLYKNISQLMLYETIHHANSILKCKIFGKRWKNLSKTGVSVQGYYLHGPSYLSGRYVLFTCCLWGNKRRSSLHIFNLGIKL
jgi:hypothetical protein